MKGWVLVLACMVLNACSTPDSVSRSDEEKILKIWPPSPQQAARIEYVRMFRGAEDLGIKPSAFRRLMSAFTGSEDTSMVRPYAVSVYGQSILVGDPGKPALHLFDLERRSYRFIPEVSDQALSSPVGVAIADDRLFVADSSMGAVFGLDYNGKTLFENDDFSRPTGLAFDHESGRLYVVDTLEHKVVVLGKDGNKRFEFGTRGINDSEFNFPSHIFLSGGKLLINDNMNFRVQEFDLDGRFLSKFGSHGDGSGFLSQPKGVAADSQGNVYVAGATIDRIQIFSQEGEFLLAFGRKGNGPGEFLMPAGVFIFDDLIYVADSYNQRIQVFRFLGGN